ncbi:MAG: osmoprotectant transport system ATP-binding protein [Chloroflexota bacterium]|jgi:osmoprotectant transport system ATP-binding protein|nr:osmoprotectant transport system ATP-binding protein [Chloroflexota bacterium]
MIRLERVTKRYPGGQVAVRELTIEFQTGQLTMLVGPSGCGKTTTLKMINRLIEPTEGRIFHDEQDVTHTDPVALRLRMGYVIQNVGLFPHLSIADNVATVPRLLGWDKKRIQQRVTELLELVGLDPKQFARRYPHQLSGGQRQRVGVARALGADPPILLMDEPFGAIDRIARERLQNEFLRIQREVRKTVIFVTHDIDEAIKLGDRIAIMNAGRLEQYDTPAAILAKPASDLVIDLLGPDRGLKRLSVTPIDLNALERPPVVHADDALSEARRVLDSRWNRVIVVDRNGKPVGELTKNDADGDGRVADRARPFDAIIGADRTLFDAFSQMLIHQATWVAVVDGDQFRGVLTPESFVAAIQRVPAELEGARR